jgi:hypothetical protein
MIMATISENLQILKDSTDAIKQAIIDKGGAIDGDISTWANVISGLSGGGSDNLKILSFNISGAGSRTRVYIEGMTWGEWVDSIYNTQDTFGVFRKSGDTGPILCNAGKVYRDNGAVQVFSSHLISDSITYTVMMGMGGGTN